jgi:peptidyl-prolyl cis-trans isomerase C
MKSASQKVVVACAVAALALACGNAGTPTAQRRAVESSPVVARVGDAVITVSDVQERINKQPPFVRARYADAAKKRELVDELVQHEAIAAEAARRGYAEDPDVQRAVKQEMISRMLKLDFESKVKIEDVPDADVEKYYNEHPADFHQKAAVGVSAIFVKDKKKADRAYADAQALPKGPANLEEQQERFRELAERSSDDRKSTALAGDLLSFSADSTVVPKPIVEAAFKLPSVGDVAPPIQTDHGWAVILLTQKRPGFDRPTSEVKRQIQQRLLRDMRSRVLEAFVGDVKAKSRITVNDANLTKVVVEAGTARGPDLTLPGPLGPPIRGPVNGDGEHGARR